MGALADEQTELEIEANAPDAPDTEVEEEDDELVELNLETGEATPVEARPPSLFFRFIAWLGHTLTDYSDLQGTPAASFEGAIEKFSSRQPVLLSLLPRHPHTARFSAKFFASAASA